MGNSCEEFTYTPQQDIARAVCKQGPTALLGLQGRRNREKPSMKHWGKLRMQRTNPLSGGCATAASPLRSQQAAKGAGSGPSGKNTRLSEPDSSRDPGDPADEEFTAGEPCPPSTHLLHEGTRLVFPSRALAPLKERDLSLQVQRDHFVIFTKHHHPSWL